MTQLHLPGYEELVRPDLPGIDFVLDWLDDCAVDKLSKATLISTMVKSFGLTSEESEQAYSYWEAQNVARQEKERLASQEQAKIEPGN